MPTARTKPFDVNVARSLEDARQRRFRVSVAPSSDYEQLRAFSSLRELSPLITLIADGSGPDLGAMDVQI